jgi:hypothetical protein
MYPDNQTLELFGETVSWPGLDGSGKFTNGSFSDPLVRPSFIPAETVNLVLDNLSELLVSLGKAPNNRSTNQLASAFADALTAATHNSWPIGSIYQSVEDTSPAILFGGTWTIWAEGRVPVGIDPGDENFNEPEMVGGEKEHSLTVGEMPSHTHVQNPHTHTFPYVSGSGTQAHILAGGGSSSTNTSISSTTATNKDTGGGEAHNNLQPYITCYMWKRTA